MPLSRNRRERVVALLLASLIVLHLIPLWTARYFPSQDGPTHLENAQLLLKFFRHDPGRFRDFYTLNPEPIPNFLGHAALAALMTFTPPLIAEKLLLSAYVILVALGACYAVRGIRRDNDSIALLIFPLIFNALLHLGFYNFSLGVALYLFTLGYWLRHRHDPSRRWPFVLALLMIVMFAAHLYPLLALWTTIAILATRDLIANPRAFRGPLKTALAAIPAAILILTSWHDVANPIRPDDIPQRLGIIEILRELPGLLISYSATERWPAIIIFLTLVIAVDAVLIRKIIRRNWIWADALLLVATLFILQALLISDPRSWELVMRPRAELFATLALILWLAAQDLAALLRRTLVGVWLAATFAMLFIHANNYRKLSTWLDEFTSAGAFIEPEKTVLPLYMPRSWNDAAGQRLTMQVSPFAHASAYLAVERGAIDLGNYEANTNHFPLIYRAGMNPYERLGPQVQHQPPCLDLAAFPIDYILIWGDMDSPSDECAQKLREQLSTWRLVYTSSRKMVHLYHSPR